MIFTLFESTVIAAAVSAIFMAGSVQIRTNLTLYSLQTMLLAESAFLIAQVRHEPDLIYVALAVAVIKGLLIPLFLNNASRKIGVHRDSSIFLVAPLAMHLCIVLFGLSYLFVRDLPVPMGELRSWPGAMSASSLVLSGLILMLTRRLALSQIIGFLVLENGIFLFALTQTKDMPMFVEMGILLDLLTGVMIAGLLVFRIQHSFEHIDVAQLTDLKE